jgi:diguanylate cyclase (GGDEF)-like protein
VGPIFHPLPWLRLPRSLRGQFAAVLAVLSLMIVAGAVAAVYALRTSSAAALQLAQQRLERMHDAQAIVEQTLHLEREADRVLAASSPPALHESYAALLAQSEMLDQLVAAFAQTSDNVAVLDLYQASQLLRNTANVVVQLRRNALEPGHSAAAHGQLERFHDEMRRQASAIVETARQQSGVYDRDFQGAVNGLVATAKRSERWILALLSGSLVFAGLVARLILGRYLLWRLQRISQHLRRDHADDRALDELASGGDEIAEMACAVRQFLADRQALEQRTAELCLTQEQLTEQGRILEMIATRAPLPGILEHLVRLIESQLQGITGSILLLDADGLHLRHGAAPGLPESYSRAIDGQRIGPRVGSCGTAMYRRETVIVADVRTDPLWEDWRGVAAAYGLRSCWSVPITSPEGEVLGSFALYSSTVRHPDAREMCRIEMAVRIAGISIERQRAEQRIRHMAHHDELTGLPNRALLNDRMAQALARSRRGGRPVAVLFLDLDGFKFINDSLGHAIGDRLLVEVAARLEASVRQGDTVARLGGDEFVVMLVDMEQADDAALVAQNILHALAQPVLVEGETLHVTTSIGVAVHPADGGDAETLLKHADAAMYRAKEQGRNAYQCYTGAIGARARQYADLQNALRRAVEQGQFELHFQPQVSLATGRIHAVEALIRWRHPELGLVSPDRFIPLAEETGLIVPIGEWVLRTACRQLQAWRNASCGDLTMAVNLSPRQLHVHDVAQLVRCVLCDTGLPAAALELELTESALIHNTEAVGATLRELKSIGVSLALDDFGTGYSSLSHLRRFPIDVIKIDKSFTFDVTGSAEAASIARAIIAMAHSLGLRTVAEGVETEEQARFLAAHQCDSIQGYHVSRPLPAAALGEQLLGAGAGQPAARPPACPSMAICLRP